LIGLSPAGARNLYVIWMFQTVSATHTAGYGVLCRGQTGGAWS